MFPRKTRIPCRKREIICRFTVAGHRIHCFDCFSRSISHHSHCRLAHLLALRRHFFRHVSRKKELVSSCVFCHMTVWITGSRLWFQWKKQSQSRTSVRLWAIMPLPPNPPFKQIGSTMSRFLRGLPCPSSGCPTTNTPGAILLGPGKKTLDIQKQG
jgi:hypothetical protein